MMMGLRAGAAPRDAAAPAPDTRFNSLAMGVLTEHLGRRHDCRVLDLGAGSAANVQFLTQFSSRICVEDLYDTLTNLGGSFSGADRRFCPLYDQLLPYRGRLTFDLVLLWNLLDYLDREEITRLAAQLAALCHSGSLIYALVSTRQKIPATPTEFRIVDHSNLLYLQADEAQREGPRYGQVRLLELMRGFRVKRSFLLRNGMQEYLFEAQ